MERVYQTASHIIPPKQTNQNPSPNHDRIFLLFPSIMKTFNFELPPTLSEAASQYGEDIKSAAPAVLRRVGDYATGLVSQTGVVIASLLNVAMIPIFTFYFLRDFDEMRLAVAEYIPQYARESIVDRLVRVDDVVGAWFRGQIQVGLILAVLYGAGWGLSFWLTGHSTFDGVALGVITGVLNIIPYVGMAVGAVLSILVVLIEWTGFGSVIGVFVVIVIVQGLEGYVITPKIVGEKVGLSPVTVIIVLLVGGEVAGLMGVLLAIPVAGAVKVIIPDILDAYTRSSYFLGPQVDSILSPSIVVSAESVVVQEVCDEPEGEGAFDGTFSQAKGPAEAEAEEDAESSESEDVPEDATEGSDAPGAESAGDDEDDVDASGDEEA